MVDRYRNYRPYRTSPPPRKSKRRGLFLLVITGFIVLGVAMVLKKGTGAEAKPTASTKNIPKKVITAEPISSTVWNQLSTQLNAQITAHPELDISVAVIDVASNTKANFGIQDNFAGASTTKVLTAVAFLHQVEIGKESLDESINGMSAKQQLKQMINRSNNESWTALNQAVGSATLENYAHSIGITSFKYTGNLMTASDEALLLQKLYKDELINTTNKQLLFSYMQNTNNEDMIPMVVPTGSTLYHKYGQLEDRLHDAAIIDYKGRPIVLVIYTKGEAEATGTEYKTRVQLVQQLAQTVFTTLYTD